MSKSRDAFRTISEVSEWLETPAHVLRFWESKFTQVKPVKRAGGRRYYRPGDMELLGGIKKLLHEDGMTIKGVQKVLREQGVRYVSGLSQPVDDVDEDGQASFEDAPFTEVTDDQIAPEQGSVVSFRREPESADSTQPIVPDDQPDERAAPEVADTKPENAEHAGYSEEVPKHDEGADLEANAATSDGTADLSSNADAEMESDMGDAHEPDEAPVDALEDSLVAPTAEDDTDSLDPLPPLSPIEDGAAELAPVEALDDTEIAEHAFDAKATEETSAVASVDDSENAPLATQPDSVANDDLDARTAADRPEQAAFAFDLPETADALFSDDTVIDADDQLDDLSPVEGSMTVDPVPQDTASDSHETPPIVAKMPETVPEASDFDDPGLRNGDAALVETGTDGNSPPPNAEPVETETAGYDCDTVSDEATFADAALEGVPTMAEESSPAAPEQTEPRTATSGGLTLPDFARPEDEGPETVSPGLLGRAVAANELSPEAARQIAAHIPALRHRYARLSAPDA